MGFPGGANGKEPNCQCRKYKNPGLIPSEEDSLEEDRQTIPVFFFFFLF